MQKEGNKMQNLRYPPVRQSSIACLRRTIHFVIPSERERVVESTHQRRS